MSSHRTQQTALILLVLLGLAVRLWGIGFGLPNTNCRPDESTLVYKALAIGGGDLNPHFFNYPTFHFYLLALFFSGYYLIGNVAGYFVGTDEFIRSFLDDPSPLFLLGRLLTALLGALSIIPVYFIGRQLGGRRVAALGAFFLSLAFLHTRESHFSTVDVPATTHLMFGVFFTLRYVKSQSFRDLAISAMLIGFATSTKYNVVLIGIPIVLVSLFSHSPITHQWKRAGWALLILAMSALVTSPYLLLDFQTAWRDITFEQDHFSTGHLGGVDLGPGWVYHVTSTLPVGLGWPLYAAAIAGFGWQLFRGRLEDRVLICGMLSYFAIAGSGKTVFMRYMLPLVPFFCIAAARFLDLATARMKRPWLVALAAVVAAPTAYSTWQHNQLLQKSDTRLAAATWLESNVPSKSKIAMVGSEYGFPAVRRSDTWLQERIADLQSADISSGRLQLLRKSGLAKVEPTYYVVEVSSGHSANLRSAHKKFDLNRLRIEGVDWVLLQDYPLAYSTTDSSILADLSLQATNVALFDPIAKTEITPKFDPLDAYYVPVSGFSAIKQPGPKLEIWRLNR